MDVNNQTSEKVILYEGSVFINRSETLKTLKISWTRFTLAPVVEAFNIRIKKTNNNEIFYNKEDVEKAINEILLFPQTHYSTEEVLSKGIEIGILEANNIYPVDIPKHYQETLKNIYGLKKVTEIKAMYKKNIIDNFIANFDTDIKSIINSIKKDEPINKGYFNILFENEMCVDSKKATELLEFESDYRKNREYLKVLRDDGYIRTVMSKGIRYCYVPDIIDIKNKRKEYFEKYVPRRISNELYCEKYGTEHANLKNRELLKIHDIPSYCIGLIKTYGSAYMGNGAFEIAELKKYLEEYAQRKGNLISSSVKGKNRMETFYFRLEEYPLGTRFLLKLNIQIKKQ